MWGRFNSRIADKLFYGMISLLILVMGGFGSLVIYERLTAEQARVEREINRTVEYLERLLPLPISRLDAKGIRQVIDADVSNSLKAIEIFDAAGERVYVYERAGRGPTHFDRKAERVVTVSGNLAGKFVTYFSVEDEMRSLRLEEFLHLIVLTSAAGLVLGIGLLFFVKRVVLTPIERTVAFSQELSQGRYDRRVDVGSSDEMGRLQQSLNRMADALQEAVENLKTSYYEAEAARREVQEGSRLKSEFLARMSHEIRTPLHAILGFADLLLDREHDGEGQNALQTIRKSAKVLLDTFNEILDLSKIEAGRTTLTPSEFSLQEVVNEISPLVKLRLHGKKVEFRSRVGETIRVRADRTRLMQVLLNLLINAAKYTEKGQIALSASPGPDAKMLFTVSDSGIGIPKEFHERIFEPFTQVGGSRSREQGGAGLGLSIAKRLVEMMGGTIWLTSEPGRGTTFFFTIPSS